MPTIRYQIEIDQEKFEELDSLMKECGFRTKKELFNNAITLFKWAINKRKNGREIGSMNGESFAELEMPALSAVSKIP